MLSTRLLEAVQEKDKSRTFELDKVVDLRPIDWVSGKKMPLSPGEGNICMRCGREHAICYHVQETTPKNEKMWIVGSGCGPKILAGWTPEKSELARAKKRATVETRLKMWEDALRDVESYVKRTLSKTVVPALTWEAGNPNYPLVAGKWKPVLKGQDVVVSGQWVDEKGSFKTDFGRPYTPDLMREDYLHEVARKYFYHRVKNKLIDYDELADFATMMRRKNIGFIQLWNSKERDFPWVKLRQQLAKMR